MTAFIRAAGAGFTVPAGDEKKAQANGFQSQTYTARSIPSTERSGKVALIVPRDGRLYAVGAYAGGGAE